MGQPCAIARQRLGGVRYSTVVVLVTYAFGRVPTADGRMAANRPRADRETPWLGVRLCHELGSCFRIAAICKLVDRNPIGAEDNDAF